MPDFSLVFKSRGSVKGKQAGEGERKDGQRVRGRGKKGNLFWRDVFRPQRGFASEAPSSHVGWLDGWSLPAYSPHNRPFFSWKAFVLGLANKGNSKVAVKGMEEAIVDKC